MERIDLSGCGIVIKGAGDLASGVAHRLISAGFPLLMLELPRPMVVRRTVSFASAVFEGSIEVEGRQASLIGNISQVESCWDAGIIPVLVDPEGTSIRALKPQVLVDAVMAKRNTGTTINDAPFVIGLGPGFTAGEDVDAVIETQRGHQLGRVIYTGCAEADTGLPAKVQGYAAERLLRAPESGVFTSYKDIGEMVQEGETVAMVNETPLYANISGLLRGLLYTGVEVKKGVKAGDIDPRGKDIDWRTVSDKARAVGGGGLESIMHFITRGG